MATAKHRRSARRALSPITWRILAVNLVALGILVAGLLYLGEYRRSLIAAELTALATQAEMFAAALGEGAVVANAADATGRRQDLVPAAARHIVRRLVEPIGTRARLFGADGVLVVDSRMLSGPGGVVQIEELPPPGERPRGIDSALDFLRRLVQWMPDFEDLPAYREGALQRAGDYAEAMRALAGERGHAVRRTQSGMVLSVAAPVQRYKQVLGALMLSKGSRDIDAALFEVRIGILEAFAVALGVTVLLSFFLAGTIARPLRRLAAAAERVRRGHHRQYGIPDFAGRDDEIGELARALSDMTEALWQRMDAIEGFAADVAHEIKNPLTSLHSAVETVARVQDPDQQRKLMGIIQEDVRRLDRLISDISDASRLDAELSRADVAPVDLRSLLAALVDLHRSTAEDGGPRIGLDAIDDRDLIVSGIEGRLSQVFRNIIANAVSFSPPDGKIMLRVDADDDWITIDVIDDGPGIPEGKETDIFERFYSERPEGEDFGTHSGLGLSISRQVIDAHGGTICAENRRDAAGAVIGSRFVVRLPNS